MIPLAKSESEAITCNRRDFASLLCTVRTVRARDMRKESLVAWIELERGFQEERTNIKISCLMYTINDSLLEVGSVVDYFYFIFIF